LSTIKIVLLVIILGVSNQSLADRYGIAGHSLSSTDLGDTS